MAETPTTEQLHATCVAINGAGVLIRGASGAGKSDLALRLIDGGAALVADDRVDLKPLGDCVVASCPQEIAGKLEVRGIGIVALPAAGPTPVSLLIDLRDSGEIERLPEPETEALLGIDIPRIAIAPFEASAPAKIRLVLGTATGAMIDPA